MPLARPVTGPGVLQRPLDEFPPNGFPVIFADGVLSSARPAPLVKFYLHRYDPHPFGEGAASQTPVAQVVMANTGFTSTALFFARTMAVLFAEKQVKREDLEAIINVCKEALDANVAR